MGQQGEEQDQNGARYGHERRHAEKREPGSNGDKFGNECQEIADRQIDHREPSPERPKAGKNQLCVSAMGGGAQAHRHFLHDHRHGEGENNEGKEKSNAKPRPGCGIGQHARPVVFSQHHQDARTDQQPQQPEPGKKSALPARRKNTRPILGPLEVLMRDRRVVEAAGNRLLQGQPRLHI